MKYTLYNEASGAITGSGSHPDPELMLGEGEALYLNEALRDDLWYFQEDGEPVARPIIEIEPEYSILADGEDAVGFPLPAGSHVRCLGTGEEWADEDEFNFSTEAVGTTVFRINPAFPYQGDIKVTIHAG